jgi:protein ImuB
LKRFGEARTPHPALPRAPSPTRGEGAERAATWSNIPTVPLVVAAKRGNVEALVAVSAAAERLGLRGGMALAQARAMHPDLAVVPEDPAADRSLLESIAEWCQRYTPLVALDPPDGILLDIAGCTHLFGGEQNLIDDLAARIASCGFTLRIAVASTIGTAIAASRHSATAIVEAGAELVFLAPLPVAALRLPDDLVAALARVGLKRISDLIDLPRAPLAARFGPELLRKLDRALGREPEPLQPRVPVAPYLAEQRFAEPIAREENVLQVIEKLAVRLKSMLERRGEGARKIELVLFRTDGAVRRIAVATSRPARDPAGIRALFREHLARLADALDPGFGFDLARLGVLVAEPLAAEQIDFSSTEHAADVDRLVDRLSARLGSHRVTRVFAQDAHLPELSALRLPAQAAAGAENGWAAFRAFRLAADLALRPPRLLVKPEPIEAIAAVPDGPPVRFRWRRALHEVVAVEGPERIECAWWTEEGGGTRDYFRVEDESGRRFWLFRAGLYRATPAPSWFLHGMFA